MPTLTGKQALMQSLIVEGVGLIFGNPGTTESPFMAALADYPDLRYITGLQEGAVMGMADGYARATGRPSFINLHIAAGLANGLSGLYNAHRGGTPLILTAGQSDTRNLVEEPFLSADLVRMTRQFTKWSYEIQHAADVPLVIRRAFKVAAEPPTGPVFLSLPWDTLDNSADFSDDDLRPPASRFTRQRPDAKALEEAVALLLHAENPLIIVGDRLAQSGGMAEMVILAEMLGAPVYFANRSEPVFPTDHPLYRGSIGPSGRGRDLIDRSDVVLAVGTNIANPFTYTKRGFIHGGAKLIHIDSSAWEVGRVYDPEVGLVCDPKTGLEEIIGALQSIVSSNKIPGGQTAIANARARIEKAKDEKRQRRERFESQAKEGWNETPIRPIRLAMELRDSFPKDAILVDESISTSSVIHAALDFNQPGAFYAHRGGGIGWGPGGAVGVALARPGQRVIAVIGDGATAYTLQAFWTAANQRLPITFIICANHAYRVLKINLAKYLGESTEERHFIGMDLNDPELQYDRLAEGFGIKGYSVREPNELGKTLRAAFAESGPNLVEVHLNGAVSQRTPSVVE